MYRSFLRVAPFAVLLLTLAISSQARADERTLVKMPDHMKVHMLGSMRSHLRILGEVFDFLGKGETDKAASVVEQHLGLSSLDEHDSKHLAPFMPPEMQAIGTEMHKASSRFVEAVQNADVEHTAVAQQKVFAALGDITQQCNACHARFRLR
jgi:cytochrome c556